MGPASVRGDVPRGPLSGDGKTRRPRDAATPQSHPTPGPLGGTRPHRGVRRGLHVGATYAGRGLAGARRRTKPGRFEDLPPHSPNNSAQAHQGREARGPGAGGGGTRAWSRREPERHPVSARGAEQQSMAPFQPRSHDRRYTAPSAAEPRCRRVADGTPVNRA